MNVWDFVLVQVGLAVSKVKISRKSKRKVKNAANKVIDAAANVIIDILRSLRK